MGMRDGAQASRRADDPAAIGDRALQILMDPRRGKHVVSAGRARSRLVAREVFRPHEREIG